MDKLAVNFYRNKQNLHVAYLYEYPFEGVGCSDDDALEKLIDIANEEFIKTGEKPIKKEDLWLYGSPPKKTLYQKIKAWITA